MFYASWDNHHILGSALPQRVGQLNAWCSHAHADFQRRLVGELLTQYEPIAEFWVDIPGFLSREDRRRQYELIAQLSPDTFVVLNQGFITGEKIQVDTAWPTDLASMERHLPSHPMQKTGYNPWFELDIPGCGRGWYYIHGEVCDTIGWEWFWHADDPPRSHAEMVGMRAVASARGVNFLLNVPPDVRGRLPDESVATLMRLRKKYEQLFGD